MRLASGEKANYALDAKPLGRGAYADVFAATHKPTGERVAFKRLHAMLGDGRERMRREISVMRQLNGTPEVMPILDADPQFEWYVMPLGDGDLMTLRVQLGDDDLVAVIGQVAAGLHAAHADGFVHRDVTPRNLLRLPSGGWVVSDWGVVRRPLGQTTQALTTNRQAIGTDGFIAPEVLRDSHKLASPAADVFSLGRVAGWAVSRRWPLAGERLLPEGPWRTWVRQATQEDPRRRPTIPELVRALDDVAYVPSERPPEQAAALAVLAREGDAQAAWRPLEMAEAHPDDAELYFDHLPGATTSALPRLVDDEQMAERLVNAMRDLLAANEWGYRDFDQYNDVLGWLHDVAEAAERRRRLGVLEDTADALFASNARLDRWPERRRCEAWLARLQGPAAEAVARALRRHPETAEWLAREWTSRTSHPIVADALQVLGR